MMKRPILHIAPTPFFSDRGCHIRIHNELQALSRNPEQYRVILCTYPLGDDSPGLDIRRPWRVPGYRNREAGFSPGRILADLWLLLLTLKVAFVEKPRLLHCHLHEGALIGWLVRTCLFWRRLPLVMDMQGSLSGELIGYGSIKPKGPLFRLIRAVEWLIYRRPHRILCSSGQSMAVVREQFGGKDLPLELLADVVPDAFFADAPAGLRQETRQALGLPPDKTILVYSGSLLAGKGLDHLHDLMRHLQDQENLFFLLIGYPTEATARFAATQGLEAKIRLTGQMPYANLARWLSVADLAVDPKEAASGEASGKLLHYMAAGLPVICFDTPNNRALLGKHGFFAPPGTPLATAAIRALQNPLAGGELVERPCGDSIRWTQRGGNCISATLPCWRIRHELTPCHPHVPVIMRQGSPFSCPIKARRRHSFPSLWKECLFFCVKLGNIDLVSTGKMPKSPKKNLSNFYVVIYIYLLFST